MSGATDSNPTFDLSKRKDGVELLADQYRTMLATTSDGFMRLDVGGRLLDVNEAYCHMSGYTREELLKMTIPALEAVEKPEDVARHIRKVITTGFDRFESKHRRKNGEVFDVEISVSHWQAANQFLLFARDVTARKLAEEALARANSKLAEVLDSIQDDFYVLGHDWVFVYASTLFTSRMGKEPEDFLVRNIWEMFPEHVGTSYEENLRATMEKREVRRFEIGGKHTNAWYEMASFPSAEGITVLGRDITERKQMEEAVRESEERFKLVATNTPDHILVQDKDLRYKWVLNPQLGLTLEDMIGKTDFDFLTGQDAARLTKIKRRVLETGSTEHVTESLVASDGSVEYFEGSYVPARDPEGKITGLIGYFKNVTERKQIEDALRESEERYRTLLESAPDAIIVHRDGYVLYANPAALELYGAGSLEELGCHNVLRMVPPEDAQTTAERAQAVMNGNHVPSREAQIVRINGEKVPVEVVSSPIEYEGGRAAQAIIRNTTERTRAEEALRESEERYRALVDSAPDAIIVHRDGKLLYANPEALGLYGAGSFQELAARNIMELVAPEEAAIAAERVRMLMAGKNVPLREGFIIRLDGQRVPTEVVSSPIDYQGGRAAQAIIRDVTDRKRAEEEMRLQATALQAAANGIVITDREGNIQWVNDAFTRLTGYGAAEAVGNNPRVLKSGQHDEAFYRTLWTTILSGRVWQGEVVNKRKDGRLYTEEMMITPVVSAGGEITNFIAIKQDISERKRAEEDLARANERMQKLLGANVIGIAEFDATKIVSANRSFLDMTGYTERDVARGRIDWREITPPEYAERDNRAWREMMEDGECLPYEKEYITRDGKRLAILIAGVRLTEDPVTGVFLNLDITDWKLMERELLETTHYADHLFDSSLIGLFRRNQEGLLDANDAFLDIVGYTRKDLEAGLIDIESMTPPEYAALDERASGEMLATGEAAPHEKEYIRKDGRRVPVLIGRKMIREEPSEWVAFVLDITERKRVEADLERMRTEFLGEVSHELKTPITAIKGCASMALSSTTPPDPVEARELFEVVDQQTNRLTDLVGNLLDMTRIEGRRLSIEPEEIDIAKTLDESRVIFEHSRYPHPLVIDLPSKLAHVRADSRRVVQVLTNLYGNAAKFSPPESPIVVTAEQVGNEVIVHISDSGAGIPGDKMPLLFQKFVQIHSMGREGNRPGPVHLQGHHRGAGRPDLGGERRRRTGRDVQLRPAGRRSSASEGREAERLGNGASRSPSPGRILGRRRRAAHTALPGAHPEERQLRGRDHEQPVASGAACEVAQSGPSAA